MPYRRQLRRRNPQTERRLKSNAGLATCSGVFVTSLRFSDLMALSISMTLQLVKMCFTDVTETILYGDRRRDTEPRLVV